MSEIEVIDYQIHWTDEFNTIAEHIGQVAAGHLLRIDHIGSTSVPTLCAKDVIDIQITVEDLTNEQLYTLLSNAGYQTRPNITQDMLVGYDNSSAELQKRFFREQSGTRRAQFHIRQQGRVNQLYPLLFRDFLRYDELTRTAYAQVKRYTLVRD